jgi:ornithine cyclodeaminase/alanine dehydrogenase-like protein (mu-crystallin family)
VLQISLDQVREVLDPAATIDAMAGIFQADSCEAPVRHHHTVRLADLPDATALLMPAWVPGRYLGAKLVNVFPSNSAVGLGAVQAVYVLFSGQTGEPLAIIDGGELTPRRTAAASALAARYLARRDASRLLVVGTGRLAPHLAAAHSAVRPIRSIKVWGRDHDKAKRLARDLRGQGLVAEAASDLTAAVAEADIVSSATLAMAPLIKGEWLKPGTHVDLVGGFTPEMREADDEAIRRASVFIDTPAALKEAGDIVLPIKHGILSRDAIRADLRDLVRGVHPGRTSEAETTLFKSVGASEEDLAAAVLVYERCRDAAGERSTAPATACA